MSRQDWVDNELILLNIVVEVAFKLLIDVVWPLTNPYIVVDVAFKLLIDNIELVDNEFRLVNIVVDVAFKTRTFGRVLDCWQRLKL